MFCDLVGSTALAARLDPEDHREIIGAQSRDRFGRTGRPSFQLTPDSPDDTAFCGELVLIMV
jgi:hypothetical protein